MKELMKSIRDPTFVPLLLPFCDFELKDLRSLLRDLLTDKVFEFEREAEQLKGYDPACKQRELEIEVCYRLWDLFHYVLDILQIDLDANIKCKWLALIAGRITNDMILIGALIPDLLKKEEQLAPSVVFALIKANLPGSGNLAILINQLRSHDPWIKAFSQLLLKSASPSTLLRTLFRDCYPPETLRFAGRALEETSPSVCEDVFGNFCAPCLFKNLPTSIYYEGMARIVRSCLKNMLAKPAVEDRDLEVLLRGPLNSGFESDHRSLVEEVRSKCSGKDLSKVAVGLPSAVKEESKVRKPQDATGHGSSAYWESHASTSAATTYHREPSSREQIIFECQDYVGLPNIGNTCYINSFLVNLYFSKEFKKFFMEEEFADPTLAMLRKIYLCLDRKDKLPLEKLAREFKATLPPDFSSNDMQHDCMEFGRVLIDKLIMSPGLEVAVP